MADELNDDKQADAIAALDALGPAHAPAESDKAPAKAKRSHSRSGTSRAQRAAKACLLYTSPSPRDS